MKQQQPDVIDCTASLYFLLREQEKIKVMILLEETYLKSYETIGVIYNLNSYTVYSKRFIHAFL